VVGSDTRRTLFFLFASVGVLLLIACANVAGLQLVRASARTREIAIRTSLGGGRGRLVRQFVTESLVLAVLGGGVGLLVAYWGVDFFRGVAAASLPRADEIRIDGRVLLVTAAATVLTGVVAGLLPALQASRLDVQHALKTTGPTVSAERRRLRDALVIAQLALSIVLLASAGLMLRTLDRLYRTDLGFNTAQLLTLQVAPAGDHVQFLTTLLERVGAVPGVRSAAVTSGAPMSTANTSVHVFPVGPARIPPSASIQAHWRIVTAGFFHAMEIPLLAGRVFAPGDDGSANKVVIVNRTLATTLWGDGDPIGRRVSPGGGDDYSTVIGVVADIRSHDPAAPPIPSFYMSAYAGMLSPMTLVVRAGDDPLALVPAIRSAVQALDPTAPVFQTKLMADLLGERVAARRTFAGLLAGFAALALALAAVGLYGVMAYATARRTREFGIRKALGARSRDLMGSVLRDAGRLVALGTAAGLVIALGVTRTMRGMLTGVGPGDPLTFVGAALLLTAVTLLACYLPARRATAADPLTALRGE
ncbi:MAG: FtsX-like permease family protein, partial [Vicinamibacterales bacterium]